MNTAVHSTWIVPQHGFALALPLMQQYLYHVGACDRLVQRMSMVCAWSQGWLCPGCPKQPCPWQLAQWGPSSCPTTCTYNQLWCSQGKFRLIWFHFSLVALMLQACDGLCCTLSPSCVSAWHVHTLMSLHMRCLQSYRSLGKSSLDMLLYVFTYNPDGLMRCSAGPSPITRWRRSRVRCAMCG